MAQLISLFNHKGGVSKTTTTFNLGWALAEAGKRVLIVDGDPQCNLTGTVLGFNGDDEFEDFYSSQRNANLNACLAPVFQGTGSPLVSATITPTKQQNLFLLAGHIDLAEAETQLAVALSTGSAIPAIQNLPGSICHLLRLTAKANSIDAVLIDMSPSVGALNACFLMGSNYFIVPTSPDYYCDQAIRSLSRVLPRWHNEVATFRNPSLTYALPSFSPKFAGIISQRYRPRDGAPAASFQKWIDKIKITVNSQLVPSLQPAKMVVSPSDFLAAGPLDTPYNLANIADFNTLIAQSQKHNTPVFALSDAQIEKQGVVLENMKDNRDDFKQTFKTLATTIISLAKL